MYANYLENMEIAAAKLTDEMNVIFAQYPECEAPEFMPESPLAQWDSLYLSRKTIYNFIARIQSINDDFTRFMFQEVD